jgi:hypothetical protein
LELARFSAMSGSFRRDRSSLFLRKDFALRPDQGAVGNN